MKTVVSAILKGLFLLLLVLNFGCTCDSSCRSERDKLAAWMEENGKLKVLCTIAMLEDIVKKIGQDNVDTLSLITGDLDPHSYQIVKGDDEKLRLADLIFYNGLGLEHGPSLQGFLTESERAISIGGYLQRLDPENVITINGQTDPHIWMDISLWADAIPLIVETLSERVPERAELFAERGKSLKEQLLQAHQEVLATMQQVPEERRYLVTSHDAFYYFSRAYLAEEGEKTDEQWKKRFNAPEGLSPESQLSTQDIQEILDYLERYQIRVIFPESNISQDSLRKIADCSRQKGIDLTIAACALYGDAMGAVGSDGDTYIKMIKHNARVIAKHLNQDAL